MTARAAGRWLCRLLAVAACLGLGVGAASAAVRRPSEGDAKRVRIEYRRVAVRRTAATATYAGRHGPGARRGAAPLAPKRTPRGARKLAALVRRRAGKPRAARPARAAPSALAVVVLDAGHGGRDPGAISRSGTMEKTVTLATVRELARQLRATHRYRVLLTRDDDRFVALDQRAAMAVRGGAALLISVHADSSPNPRAHGASVYVRSAHYPAAAPVHLPASRAASRAIDRALTAPADAASAPEPEAARLQMAMVNSLDDDLPMTAEPARQARLRVLAALGVPSVLLEIGFLSNRQDETLMQRPEHRRVIALAIRDAVDDFFSGQGETTRSRL